MSLVVGGVAAVVVALVAVVWARRHWHVSLYPTTRTHLLGGGPGRREGGDDAAG